MKTEIIKVEGMSCSHCVNAIRSAVGELVGVYDVTVDLAGKTVTVTFNDTLVSLETIKNEIEDQGYEVI